LPGGLAKKVMHNISLRAATKDDAAFALHVTEACMRRYAEQAWGSWNGRADLDLTFDQIIQLAGRDIGLIGINRRSDCWFLDKLYLLPAYQNQGLGSHLLQCLIEDAKSAQVVLRLTVLEANPARRLYERHGFVLTHTISPRHHMEWRGPEGVLLRYLEEQLLKPEVRTSPDRVGYLLADDFIEFGSSGRIFDKRQIIEALQQEADSARRVSVADFMVRQLASDAMLVTYRATSEDRGGSRLRSSFWKLIDGRWQMIFHQGTPSAD
jgi:GNAT superfamily N-acetyltransferase